MTFHKVFKFGLVVFPLCVYLGISIDLREPKDVSAGELAPDCELVGLRDGVARRIGAPRKTPILLNFWASWCEPCKVEQPILDDIAREFHDRVEVLGVVYGETAEAARVHLAVNGTRYEHVIDSEARCASAFDVRGIPHSVLIDAGGKIVDVYTGSLTREYLLRALGAVAARGASDAAP